ncbi:MAG: (2Fe-2S)-binding protein [Pseudomonadota bacterium]
MDTEELLDYSILVRCRINGKFVEEEVSPDTTLLAFLRENRRLTGTHMGCMTGHCGACTVLLDGKTAKSCVTHIAAVQRAEITTIEGLEGADGVLSDIQQAFWDEAGFQCGYCAPGMLLSAQELLRDNAEPDDQAIRTAIAGNLCRCTGYQSIVRSIKEAARRAAGTADTTSTHAEGNAK